VGALSRLVPGVLEEGKDLGRKTVDNHGEDNVRAYTRVPVGLKVAKTPASGPVRWWLCEIGVRDWDVERSQEGFKPSRWQRINCADFYNDGVPRGRKGDGNKKTTDVTLASVRSKSQLERIESV
jgi:hypothetical protein